MNKISTVLLRLAVLLFVFSAGVGCKPAVSPSAPQGEIEISIQITSIAFSEGGMIPRKYTCDDIDHSPPLEWSGVPEATKSLVLIADDPDAPVGTWVHWVIYNIPTDLTGLPEGVTGVGTDGKNDFGMEGYSGPCPPKGPAHRYYFKLYALDNELSLDPGATKTELEKAMQGHILAQGQLMGMYER